MIKKYTYGREWEEAQVVELTFELIDGRLVAPVGHRKRTRKYLHGHYHTSVDDARLYDSKNQCIDAYVTTLKLTIAPTLRKIATLEAQRTGGIDLSAYEVRLAEHHQAEFESLHRD
jgi:hypothetical protein